MFYKPIQEMRGVWGLENRLYSDAEIQASFHLTSALHAGAFEVVTHPGNDAPLSTESAPQTGVIDLRDGVDDDEAGIAARALRKRREIKEDK